MRSSSISPGAGSTDDDRGPRSADAGGLAVAIVVARYHRGVTDSLERGAAHAWAQRGGQPARLYIIDAPGTFELPVLCRAAARRSDVHAVVALGCVIRGETPHDMVIAHSVAAAIQQIALETGKPVAFGVLTCLSLAQAQDRAGGRHGNKGEDAMHAALDTSLALRRTLTEDTLAQERR